MNEIGASDTTGNMISIIEAAKTAGADVIVMGVPRTNSLGGRSNFDEWSDTNHRLWLAAMHCGVAYVSTSYLQGDRNLGFMGLSPG